ncbi:MAG: class A beta-lactamase-related serine hydrolase, partial [Anaerolineae bacterium]|nr:class A beta-lactamase-related serine hydrolase [Anaerolineae bacterium]
MRSRNPLSILRWISLIFIFASILLTVIQLVRYSRLRNNFPPGMVMAGVHVGGLSQQEAAERLTQAYSIPVEIRYQDAIIQIKPALVGFNLDMTAMLAAADLQRINQPFWSAFWAYLWGNLPQPGEVPLIASVSEDRLRNYLETEIAPRYDAPPTPAMPVVGTADFSAGKPGTTLDIDRAVVLISDALRSSSSRVVNLSYNRSASARPSFSVLSTMLKQLIDVDGFEGVAEIYLKDLETGNELDLAYQKGSELPADISFTAASTMKIPIMITVYRRTAEPTPQNITSQIERMIRYSENGPADTLLQEAVDVNLGPLAVTSDMKALGLQNTFLAGYFYPGAPLLQRIQTPANSRTDISTDPDAYNQTTAADMGMMMEDIYDCSERGGGTLAAVFEGEITQGECKQMINYLEMDRIGVLIQGGLPDGARVAHKHGWITEYDGYIHTIGDTAIVYSPRGNYILSIFMHDPVQLVWESANLLFARLSNA